MHQSCPHFQNAAKVRWFYSIVFFSLNSNYCQARELIRLLIWVTFWFVYFQHYFSNLIRSTETFRLMEQLANMAMRQWVSNNLYVIFMSNLYVYRLGGVQELVWMLATHSSSSPNPYKDWTRNCPPFRYKQSSENSAKLSPPLKMEKLLLLAAVKYIMQYKTGYFAAFHCHVGKLLHCNCTIHCRHWLWQKGLRIIVWVIRAKGLYLYL